MTRRSNLEWARDIARIYRNALRAAAPDKCTELDELARARGQKWIAPTELPAEAVEAALEAELPPKQIEEYFAVPASTLYAWASKGLLTNRGRKGAPLYLVSEILAVEARNRAA
ncbi:hypothetical protein OIE68_15480 [Nocardia vinacea]|uniref:hypothetical protein n=1 Tax=Nocardia vinacea TaxID=96468 RepID=UPI002E0DB7EB|nr:hypothetical protein OIE68_15480 [Nocardia vinacea]